VSCSLQVKRCAADHYPGPRLGTANSGDRAGVLIVCRQGQSTLVTPTQIGRMAINSPILSIRCSGLPNSSDQ
jgi:hypothetical protein